MSPWFRRRRDEPASPPERVPERVTPEAPEREPAAPERTAEREPEPPEPALDPTGPLSVERLDRALDRLRKEHPAPDGDHGRPDR